MYQAPAPVRRSVASGTRRRMLSIAVAVVAALGIFLALYAALSSTDGSTRSSQAANAGAGTVGAAGAKASGAAGAKASGAFTAHTLDGATVDVPGSRPSALFFFSAQCAACGPGAQALAQAQKAVGAKANFVAVDINPGDSDGDIRGFLRDNQAAGLALIRDTDARLLRGFHVNQLSTAVILDASGNVAYRAVDPTATQIESELAKVSAR